MPSALDLAHVKPMLAQARKSLPVSNDWWWSLKFDGYRLLASTKPFGLKTRNGADATAWFPELQDALASIAHSQHTLDGEVCVLDEIGRSDFNRLHARARRKGRYEGADPVVHRGVDLLRPASSIVTKSVSQTSRYNLSGPRCTARGYATCNATLS